MPEWLKGTGCKPVGYAYLGSNPSAPTISACVAQSVEHFVGNEEVTGSSPVAGSTWRCSSVGQSTRFIPVASLVQIQSPLPEELSRPLVGRVIYFLFSFSVFFNERRIIKVIPAIIKYIILRIRLVIKAPAVFEFPDIITRNITKKLIKKPI